jgi:hypothetical protein
MAFISSRLTEPTPHIYITGQDGNPVRTQVPSKRMRAGCIASIALGKVPWMTIMAVLNYFRMYYCCFATDTLVRATVARYALGPITETCKNGYVTISMFRRIQA